MPCLVCGRKCIAESEFPNDQQDTNYPKKCGLTALYWVQMRVIRFQKNPKNAQSYFEKRKKYMRVVDADEPQDPSRQQVHRRTSRLTTRSNRQLRLHAVWISHSLPYLLGSVKQLFINSGLGNSNETRPDFANGIRWIPGTEYWITQYIMCITHSICCFCLHWRSWRLLSKVCTRYHRQTEIWCIRETSRVCSVQDSTKLQSQEKSKRRLYTDDTQPRRWLELNLTSNWSRPSVIHCNTLTAQNSAPRYQQRKISEQGRCDCCSCCHFVVPR